MVVGVVEGILSIYYVGSGVTWGVGVLVQVTLIKASPLSMFIICIGRSRYKIELLQTGHARKQN